MYWIAKLFQAAGLVLMAWAFISNYPALMPHHLLLLAGTFFIIGWLIQSYLLRK